MTALTFPTVTFPNGVSVPSLGQGTWFMGEHSSKKQQEISVLKQGVEAGLTLIDTAEMYADGGAEKVVGDAIQGIRERVFLVSKVLPMNASRHGTRKALEGSLKRLKTDYLDLYLLHWRGGVPLQETVDILETLKDEGKIGAWGVSNFDVDDMEELSHCQHKYPISTNQVLYNLTRRGIEFDLMPWCQKQNIPIMAYSPIEQGRLLNHPLLQQLAQEHNATPAQIALAWVLSHKNVIAIPKTSQSKHLELNIASLTIKLTPDNYKQLDLVFLPPKRKVSLQML